MRRIVLSVMALALSASTALAENVDFTGTVDSGCSIVASSNGTLKLDLATGTTLGSEVAGGTPGSVTILSIGASTLTVGVPSRTSPPPSGYNTATETVEVSYSGASGLSGINQGYTSAQTTQSLGTIGASVLTVHNHIINPNGFPADTYTTRTQITCAHP